jgi:hypothetical protein
MWRFASRLYVLAFPGFVRSRKEQRKRRAKTGKILVVVDNQHVVTGSI